jgi:UPF0755 protein
MKRLPAIVMGLVLVALVGAGVYLVLGQGFELARAVLGDLDSPVSRDSTVTLFGVESGQSAAEIGGRLERAGLIRSARVFRVEVERQGVGGRLAAGEYELSPSMSTPEIIAVLAGGRVRRGVALTLPEGWRAEEIAWKLDALAPGAGREFLDAVYGGAGLPPGLDPPAGASLEGLLFPETYEWQPGSEVRALVDRMLGQFGRRFDAARRKEAAERGLTPHEVVILASIVEREAVLPQERPLIAAVYSNRLGLGMPLQADPTVQYALIEPRVPAPGDVLWKRDLTLQDLEVVSPYNTYRRVGLPAGPICNPGLASLDAALRPADTDALYFVAREDGSHVFARTLQEHLANVRRYQSGGPY